MNILPFSPPHSSRLFLSLAVHSHPVARSAPTSIANRDNDEHVEEVNEENNKSKAQLGPIERRRRCQRYHFGFRNRLFSFADYYSAKGELG